MADSSPAGRYKEVLADSPAAAASRLIEVYDIAIRAAILHQPEGILYCIGLLRSTIDAEPAPELALSLMAVYSDIESAANHRDFATAAEMLETVRAMWVARRKLDSLERS